jgi:hypothetical protein
VPRRGAARRRLRSARSRQAAAAAAAGPAARSTGVSFFSLSTRTSTQRYRNIATSSCGANVCKWALCNHNLVPVILRYGVYTTCGCSGAVEHGHNRGLCIVLTFSWCVANFGFSSHLATEADAAADESTCPSTLTRCKRSTCLRGARTAPTIAQRSPITVAGSTRWQLANGNITVVCFLCLVMDLLQPPAG